MPICTHGILLPNGVFLPNEGDGHAKNASRFCRKFPNLDKLKDSFSCNADEFMLMAGCAIVAGYRGERCFKVAKDNENLLIKALMIDYKQEGYKIYACWNLDVISKSTLEEIINNIPKMQIILRENTTDGLKK